MKKLLFIICLLFPLCGYSQSMFEKIITSGKKPIDMSLQAVKSHIESTKLYELDSQNDLAINYLHKEYQAGDKILPLNILIKLKDNSVVYIVEQLIINDSIFLDLIEKFKKWDSQYVNIDGTHYFRTIDCFMKKMNDDGEYIIMYQHLPKNN